MLLTLIPKVFYADIQVGLDLFVRCLGFEVLHRDPSITVLGRDGVKVYLMQNAELAALDRPELAIETDNIAAIYDEVKARAPQGFSAITLELGCSISGAREFAVLDATTVCVIFRQWS